jgi:selenide,water dikinase
MSTLNRNAAEAARPLEPHAVTDVTGFGLAGHAAEMAEASGVDIELDLGSLPLLPGALKAASIGMVPAGAGKNRESLESVMTMEEGADPLLVDMTLDPQTSGGLLLALEPEQAKKLVTRLPGAEPVGKCVEGSGGIRLVKELDSSKPGKP